MNKKIITGILCISMMLANTSVFASEDTKTLLGAMDIMNGDENGSFDDFGTLTREQFAKITVAIADPDYISTNSSAPFYDVSGSRWSAGYIDHANQMGFFHGYPDGSFRPEEEIVPEQVCKVMLKLLGYENENITGNWALSQISFASGKGLLDGVNYSIGTPITRIEAAKIIKNALLTQIKDSEGYLVEAMGYAYLEDSVVLTDKNTQSGYVSTSNGIFKKNEDFDASDIGKKGDLIVDKKGKIVCFLPDNQSCKNYTVKTASGDSIAVFGNSSAISGISDETLCFVSGRQTSFADMKQMLKTGDNLTVAYTSSGNIDYVSTSGNSMTSPKFIKNIPVNAETKYIRDGNNSSSSEIDALDVCYYLENENTVVAYSKRMTGVFENAYPSKENITAVVLSGNTYQIGHTNATNKLSSDGDIKYGDTITLLFGKDDTVVDVITLSESEKVYGVLLESSLKNRLDKNGNRLSEYAASIMRTDGTVTEYSADKDYDSLKGKAVAVSFKNGLASISSINSGDGVNGNFDWNKKSLGKYILSSDIDIIDVAYDTDYSAAKSKEIFPQRLDGASISSDDILYAQIKGSEIQALILDDFTNDVYDYGIVLYAKNLSSDYATAGEYKVNINGSYSEFVTQNTAFNISSGQPAKFETDAAKGIVGIQKLNAVSDSITGVDELYAYTRNNKYRLSDDVIVYHQVNKTGDATGYRYEMISKDKMDFGKSVTAYCDKSEKSGGRIRVLVVK